MNAHPEFSAATELSASEADELARDVVAAQQQAAVAAAARRHGVARAEALASAAGVAVAAPAPRVGVAAPAPASSPAAAPARATARGLGRCAPHPRFADRATAWRRSVRFAMQRRMYTPEYLQLYARYLSQRLRHPHVELQGMVFFGPHVELLARPRHARLSLGSWCWIGARTSLRAHEGNVRLGAKVVMGGDNVVNAYLDIEIGENALFGDHVYICDFDHNYGRLDVPIRKQGLAKTPVRVGEDVWVGEKVSILRGADIGSGSVIGSQTVVKGHIPPFSVAVGAPARVVRSRLPKGMTPEEALALQRRGETIPGDPLGD